VGGVNWVGWYFANRNRWLTTIRYMPLRNMLTSLLIALPLEFIINIAKSIRRQERQRASLYAKILKFIAKEFVSDVRKRANVGDVRKLKELIISVKSPLSKEQEALAYIARKISTYVLRVG